MSIAKRNETTVANVSKDKTTGGLQMNYIEEILQLVESEEMREHLLKWLTHKDTRHPHRACADIVFNAPVSIEKKLTLLKVLSEQSRHEGDDYPEINEYARSIQKALDERNKNNLGEIIELTVDGVDYVEYTSFDEAVKCIKQVMTHNNTASIDESTSTDKKYIIEKSVEIEDYFDTLASWYLNDNGEILYYSPNTSENISGSMSFPVPFKPGDIIVADCSPFAEEKKLLILENYDTFGSVCGYNVTCLFLNGDNKICVGYLKFNEFLTSHRDSHISVMYRARTYNGELTEAEAPLGVISSAIRKNPQLGSMIYRFVDNVRLIIEIAPCYLEGYLPDALSDTHKDKTQCDLEWRRLADEFHLK